MKSKQDIDSARIVFMGTPEFAVASLVELVQKGFNIVGVVTAQDKPAGRGQKTKESPVKTTAVEYQIPVFQPERLKDQVFVRELTDLAPDLIIVVAFRMLPELVWRIPQLGTFNLHASLLPQYRGAAPINWALINGEKESGITTFFINEQIDTGNIIFQEKVQIKDNMSAGQLHDILMKQGAGLTCKTAEAIIRNEVVSVPQTETDTAELKQAPKIHKQDCKINWRNSAIQINNLIRGLSPYPSAWTTFVNSEGESITAKILQAHIVPEDDLNTGSIKISENNQLLIGTGSSNVSVDLIQAEGKRKMEIQDYLRGLRSPLVKAI